MIFKPKEEPQPVLGIPGYTDSRSPRCTTLAIDNSGSMLDGDYFPNRLEAAKTSALAFHDELITKGEIHDKIAVVSFGSSARVECDLTPVTESARIEKAIRNIKPDGFTNMRAGLIQAERIFFGDPCIVPLAIAKAFNWLATGQTRHVDPNVVMKVILLTDGRHCYGEHPLPVAERLKHNGVEISGVGIAGSPNQVDEELLKKLVSTDPTTGLPQYRFIKDAQQLISHYRCLAKGITR